MIRLSFLVILLTFVIDSGSGKPTSSCDLKIVEPRIEKCLVTLASVSEAMKHRRELNPEQEQKYLKDCDSFMTCKPDFMCSKTFSDLMEVAFGVMEAHCKSARFMATEFKECDNKLKTLNSTCQQSYIPFQEVRVEDVPDIMKHGGSKKCEELFLEGDCMRSDVLKVCGEKDWEKLRSFQLEDAKAMRLCQTEK